VKDPALGRQIVDRILAMLINEAVDAVHTGIASAADVEMAMTRGVNYPKGLLSWGDTLGPAHVLAALETLAADTGDPRYRASTRLRQCVRDGRALLS
jgi:3-hydroxybutyryl-CoA dehydrogenase